MLFAHRQTDQGAALLGRRCFDPACMDSPLRLCHLRRRACMDSRASALSFAYGQPSFGSVICAGVPLALRVWTAELQL